MSSEIITTVVVSYAFTGYVFYLWGHRAGYKAGHKEPTVWRVQLNDLSGGKTLIYENGVIRECNDNDA